ncbi:hypothetical protein [Rhizobium tumorigenes]|uniref:hypothetical protein n=1 Tax=Rhizobium tumorigenes TaxID=2041385 RepID=UPI00241C275F|nr:hypothetical protein [Rhizobium tumorigenes]WFS01622.1 hypothetical protein PR016_03015 [Rhizobium tumorigenes]WFS02198.1 hypothetical protein PR016_06185 [Rhizobium tumorigenes]
MPKFRKKPVEIEAFQWLVPTKFPRFIEDALRSDTICLVDGRWYVQTLETGELAPKHLITAGDWIIQGVQGELYPCKPDIFAATYEQVED